MASLCPSSSRISGYADNPPLVGQRTILPTWGDHPIPFPRLLAKVTIWSPLPPPSGKTTLILSPAFGQATIPIPSPPLRGSAPGHRARVRGLKRKALALSRPAH